MKDDSLENLLANEMKIVFKYLIKIGASLEDAEDVVQDTMYKVITNIDSLNADKIISWLFKVSINSYYNIYNQNKKKDIYIDIDDTSLKQLSDNIFTEEEVLNEEFKDYINKALNSLKPSYKNLLILRYFMCLSYKEISLLLGINESTVKTYLYRARNKFREIWEGLKYD
ncbi:RNA polymerase factor sigma-70 RpoD [Gottschalkia acidurici 9a]|uniref:RNA polymerase factor sigma-70 RpoD n=1 Tax=Gottschalkia acidurici (strain ATCC 7906 / DSM 604 / BCRC 14475 / CIP 104303 / KCTC 5404 / NCIMB 10678 / 9a) TaxID=1128398 RepID=K0B2T8_GOTA9|nr:RNA polymerase sigma factor [Gottschalkia acidurici]AFS78911.1 RNA polymerase factor sigma-70 RpoD [Gottschalkia acidurici 9a]